MKSRLVFEAAAEPKTLRVFPGLGHNDPALTGGAPLLELVLPFLRDLDLP